MVCAFDGIVTRAERVYEGVEDDHYRCDAGHAFGVDWRRGGPTEPAWPLSAEMVAAIEASAEAEPAAAGDMVADTAVRRFVRGPSVSDSAAVLAWLADRQAEQRRLRLPVVLVRGDVGFNLRDARIGGRELLKIRCDDSALGVGLDDRAQQVCRDAASCALWLEGFWRGGEARVFAVVKVGASVTDAELADAAAEREATDERVG